LHPIHVKPYQINNKVKNELSKIRVRIFQNRILRQIFGHKGSGKGSTMRNFIVCTVQGSRVIKSSRLRWARYVARMREGRNDFIIFTGTPTGCRYFDLVTHFLSEAK
jgi:hypothetical protein